MSFAVIATGVGTTLVGSAIQAGAAGDAADTSSAQAMANAANLRNSSITGSRLQKQSGERADDLLKGSGARADDLLQQGYQGARQDLAPYDSLGLQGSNALARYLGFAPAYGGNRPAPPKAPVAPKAPAQKGASGGNSVATSVEAMMDEWRSANAAIIGTPGYNAPSPANEAMARARLTKKAERENKAAQGNTKGATAKGQADYKKAQAKYKADLAKYKTDRAAYTARQKAVGDFGDYNRPYTQAKFNLKTDPIYKTELNENVRAWDQSAASRGSLMSGNTVAGLRELTAGGIGRAYDRYWGENDRGYNRYEADQAQKFNALSGLNNMGLGVRSGLADARMQMAGNRANIGAQVGSQRASTGVNVAANRANTLMQGSGAQAQYAQQGADARAAGQIGQGQAWSNAFNNVGQLGMLYGLGAFGGGSANGGNQAVQQFRQSGGRPWY